ncbi:MAG TPA: SIS domain-containing protein [Herpetosiphonaceae bacterium]
MTMVLESHLYREIHEQPATLERLLTAERPAVERLAAAIREREIEHIVIAARGTSDNAARYAQYVFGAHNRMLVSLATPSLFSLYHTPPRFGKALVLGISQSGQSPDIRAVVSEARQQGALTAAITNVPESPLAQSADHVLSLGAGPERSVAATKTYTSQLALIAMLSVALSGDASLDGALSQLPGWADATLKLQSGMESHVQRYRFMPRCVVIGRGFNYATAYELSLKLKELTYTIVEPYSTADFLHGPMAMIEDGFPVIVVAPSGQLLEEQQGFIRQLKQRGAEVIVISDDAATLALGPVGLALPAGVPEWLSPVMAIMPGQLFALHLAHTRGYDVDQPRGLNKVTETH